MVKRFLLPLVAVIIILAMIIPGCGGPVEPTPEDIAVTILVRTEDERKELGEYVAGQLEDLGFVVNIQYGTSSVLGPIWTGDPNLGLWNAYTGGWVTTVVARDEGDNAAFFGTDLGAPYMGALWVAYGHDMDWYADAEALWNYDFSTMAEREALIETNFWGFMENAVRLFLIDRSSFSAFRKGLNLAADASGGIYGSWMWAYTLHWQDLAGDPDPANDATVRIAMTDILTQPWNPVAGTNWVYDMFPIRATGDAGHGVDTNDGIRWPGVFEKADVVAATGLPIGLQYPDPPENWLTLTFDSDPITAADEAWVSWNVTSKTPITVAEKVAANPEWSPVAQRMSRTYYPLGTFGIDIHDGSELSLADFLYGYIIPFERGQEGGMIYDTAYTSAYNAFVSGFKGVKFITDDPNYDLIVEYWSNVWNLDAEYCVTHMYPVYSQGPGMWHTLALAILGEDNNECAFSQAKAVDPIVWTNFIGTGKEILATHMAAVIADTEDVPFEAFIEAEYTARTLGSFATEISTRMTNLNTWYGTHDHFWVATGPMYADAFTFTPKSIVLKKFPTYHSSADKWLFLMGLDPTGLPEMGAWVEQVNLEVEATPAQAISRLQSNDLDIFAFGLSDADLFATVQGDANLDYVLSVGSYNELTLNPVGPILDIEGEDWFNPFGIAAVREALHFALDRSYIVGTVMSGLGYERWLPVSTVGGEAARYPVLIADIEAFYAYDFAEADARIEAAMLAISGVTRDAGQYKYLAP
jgi:peptide/nickel transport system substrate-binding protein